MRRRKTFAPSLVDRLEDRLAPSQLGGHPSAQIGHDPASHGGRHQVKSQAAVPAIVLSGTIEGQSLRGGSGAIDGLGPVTTKGTLKASGAHQVIYRGQITLTGAAGSITAKLSGRSSAASEPGTPVDLTYRIIGGSGAFKGARGAGRAMFSQSVASQPGAVTLAFGAAASPSSPTAVPPSVVPPTAPPTSTPPYPSPPPQVTPAPDVVLTGTMVGGTSEEASGTVDPLGAVTGSWTLTHSGAEPVAYTGTLTLAGASGTIT